MRKAVKSDEKLVVNILSDAFDTNKSVNYVVHQDELRHTRIRRLMAYSFNLCIQFGEVWISDDNLACALLLLPDTKRFTLHSLLWDVKLALSVIGLKRISVVLKRESMIKSLHPKIPICHLWFIGVKPVMQGKGIGGTLIRDVIRECEGKNRPIYLETSVDRNLPWYKSFGFEIFRSLELTYTLYLLRRHHPAARAN